jgi:hypothetical protein
MEFQALYNRIKPITVYGSSRAPVCLGLQSVVSVLGIPHIGGSPSMLLSDPATAPTFMRVVPSDNTSVGALVGLLHRFQWVHVAVLASNDEFGEGAAVIYRKSSRRCLKLTIFFVTVVVDLLQSHSAGIVVLQRHIYLPSDVAAMRNSLQQIKTAGLRIIFVACAQNGFPAVFQAAKEFEMLGPEYAWIVGDQVFYRDTEIFPDGVFTVNKDYGEGPKTDRFYQSLALIDPRPPVPFPGLTYVYDAVYLIARTAKKVLDMGASPFNTSLMFSEMRAASFEGATGMIQSDGADRANGFALFDSIFSLAEKKPNLVP